MSLLMQALKKAERNKRDTPPGEDDAALPSEELDRILALTPDDMVAGRVPPAPDAPALSLETMEAAQARAAEPAGGGDEPAPALEPATPAPHDPTPPQSRRQRDAAALAPMPDLGATVAAPGGREAPDAEAKAKAEAEAGARSDATHPDAPPSAPRGAQARPASGRAQGTAARARAAAQAAARQDQPRRDPARVRLATLGGALALVAGTLAGAYWYALTSPGPGASLPPVPMPPPGAPAGAAPVAVLAPEAGRPDGQAPDATDPPGGLAPGAPVPSQAAPGPMRPGPAMDTAQVRAPGGSRMPSDDDVQRALQQQAAPPAAAPVAAAVPPGGGPASDIQVARGGAPQRINAALQDGYQAFMAGNDTAAAQHYASALRQDPDNRDALLGNSAIAARRNDIAAATSGYQRLLELNPNDADAQAALLALRPGDPGQSELRLKELLRRDPGAGPLEFALGNLYAQQGRWPDAQQAYFRAYSSAPENADYAFNLAVGLDRLSQRALALTYYRRALDLSRSGPAAFDRDAARRRAGQLAASAPPDSGGQP